MRMTLFGRRTVDANGEPEAKTYYDYKQKVKAKRKIAWHLIYVGAGFLFVAILLTVVFGMVS